MAKKNKKRATIDEDLDLLFSSGTLNIVPEEEVNEVKVPTSPRVEESVSESSESSEAKVLRILRHMKCWRVTLLDGTVVDYPFSEFHSVDDVLQTL